MSVFDAGGQRLATQVGGALTNVCVYDAMGKLVAEYGPASSGPGGTSYLMSDHQGSPRVVTNGTGSVVSRHDYLAFGEELSTVGMRTSGQGYAGVDNARQKYAGMETDDATGMDHTLWRQFDSSSGRWTSPDPYTASMTIANPQSFNRYSYVGNDPVDMRDPSGLMTKERQPDPDAAAATEEPPGDPFETGRDIISAAEARHDRWVDIDRKGGNYGDADYPKTSKGDTAGGGDEGKAGGDSPADISTATVGLAESTMGLPQGNNPEENFQPWVISNVAGLGQKILSNDAAGTPWDGYRDVNNVRNCAQLPEMWDFAHEGKRIKPRRTPNWRMGPALEWGMYLSPGTVAATFDRQTAMYRNATSGNHTIIFLSWYEEKKTVGYFWLKKTVTVRGMWVTEQGPYWLPRGRKIPFDSNAVYHSNAGAFNVVLINQPSRSTRRR